MIDRLLRERDAADLLAVCPRTLRKWRQEGKIEFALIGSAIRYSLADLHAFIAESKIKCASIKETAARSGGTISRSQVVDIAAARAKRQNAKRG